MFDFCEVTLPPSRRFFFYCFAFIVGIGLGSTVPFLISFILAWITFFVFIIFRQRSLPLSVVLLFVVSCCSGAAWYAWRVPSDHWWSNLSARPVTFVGEVTTPPQIHATTQTVFMSVYKIDGFVVSRALSLRSSLPLSLKIEEGDKITAKGELAVSPKGRTRVLSGKNIVVQKVLPGNDWHPLLTSGVIRLVRATREVYPAPTSDFIAGILVGGKNTLGNYWKNLLSTTGTTHLVALSGFNVTIMMSAILAVMAAIGIPRKMEIWIVLGFLFLFVLAVGASASLIRAVVMGVVALYGRLLGRTSATINALLFAAVVMLLFTPTLLRDDLGFQLSFLATWGLLVIYPHLDNWLRHWPNPLGFKEALLMAISAEIMVTPWLLFTFGQLSIVSPFVNMLVVPPIPAIMFFGFLGSVGGLISTQLGQVLGFGAYVGASAVLGIIQWAAHLPWAAVSFTVSPVFIVGYYLVLGGLLWFRPHSSS